MEKRSSNDKNDVLVWNASNIMDRTFVEKGNVKKNREFKEI